MNDQTDDTRVVRASSDSALYYYDLGWKQILDLGQWTNSELSFRRAAALDSTFLIGLSLVGRISSDLQERLAIYRTLKANRHTLSSDEQMLLDVFISNIDLMNLREGGGNTTDLRVAHRANAERTFGYIAHHYSGEHYIRAEYIEYIHANHGAQAALDTMQQFASLNSGIPFYTHYKATLQSELGNYAQALATAKIFEEQVTNTACSAPFATYAAIYFDMDSVERAKSYIDQAVALDEKNLSAKGLQRRIDSKLDTEK